jgi:membrane peptidoglycan carboxypeptidase
MTSVHGISVAGGTFPAQIWRLFMSSAIGQLEPEEFAEPTDWPEWVEFERGQYARSFGYYDDGSSDYTPPATTEEEETDNGAAPAPTDSVPDAPPASRPAPKPKPVTPAPTPPVTPVPPPATTEPPPTPTEPQLP